MGLLKRNGQGHAGVDAAGVRRGRLLEEGASLVRLAQTLQLVADLEHQFGVMRLQFHCLSPGAVCQVDLAIASGRTSILEPNWRAMGKLARQFLVSRDRLRKIPGPRKPASLIEFLVRNIHHDPLQWTRTAEENKDFFARRTRRMTQKETNFYFFSARVSKPLGVRWLSCLGSV